MSDGTYLYSFWTIGATNYAWRHNLDGTLSGPAQVPMLNGSEIYDVAARGGAIVYATVPVGSTNVVVRWLDPTTLTALSGGATITPVSTTVTSLRVTLSPDGTTARVYVGAVDPTLTTITRIDRYSMTRTSGAGTGALMTLQDGAWDIASQGAYDYLAYVTYTSNRLNYLEIDAAGSYSTYTVRVTGGDITLVDPSIAFATPTYIVVAWATRSATSDSRNVYAALSGVGGTPTIYPISAPGFTTGRPTGIGDAVSMTDIACASDGVCAISTLEATSAAPTLGSVNVYHINSATGAHFSVPTGLLLSVDQGLPIMRPGAGRPDLLFYNPSTNAVAVEPLGCF